MKLRCQWKGAKCPPYVHEGIFEANNETLTRFESDMNWCAKCTACATPALPSFQDELLQIARITLWEKGPAFDPNHEKKASFRTYILPWICGALTREKKKETQHYWRFMPASSEKPSPHEAAEAEDNWEEVLFFGIEDTRTDFVDSLIWKMWNADFEETLPQLVQCLTRREQQVFAAIRANMKQSDIAKKLTLSKARISQLVGKVESKLIRECQNRGLIE